MIIIYEKHIIEGDENYFIECPEEEATHIHYCYNDDKKPCIRENRNI